MSLQHTIQLRPSNGQVYDNSAEIIAAFHAGHYFQEILPNGDTGRMWVTIDDLDADEVVKVSYMRIVGDFNFGDRYAIDRTFSITFRVVKDEELEEV
jgi:hypothetical protein